MNKGKPSGFKADTKNDVGAKSTSRSRRGQAGAGTQDSGSKTTTAHASADTLQSRSVSRRSSADKTVTRFPEIRNGAGTNGDGHVQATHFEFNDGAAKRVCIAGTFNDWHPDVTEMISLGEGNWRKELLLPPGEYEYRLVVDGNWMVDPRCSLQKPNGLGEMNSVVVVPQ